MSYRVLVLYNEPVLPADHPEYEAEFEVVATAECAANAITTAGFDVRMAGCCRDPEAIVRAVREHQPDVVLNLFEGSADHGQTEAYAAGILEWLRVPYTGSRPHTLTLARCKHLAKQLLRGAGLPTAPFMVVHKLPMPPCTVPWPAIVKPAMEDGSVGVDQGSVVTNTEDLEARVTMLLERYGGPVLVEEYIPGREIVIAITEVPTIRFLPITEFLVADIAKAFPNQWPIMTYDCKWTPGTEDYEKIDVEFGAQFPADVTAELHDLALQAYRLLECRDYARVDFRLRPDGRPFILEVNPNPDVREGTGMANSLDAMAIPYRDFMVDLLHTALRRGESTGVPLAFANTLPAKPVQ
jgi:D-alanine-D-alanine ligase